MFDEESKDIAQIYHFTDKADRTKDVFLGTASLEKGYNISRVERTSADNKEFAKQNRQTEEFDQWVQAENDQQAVHLNELGVRASVMTAGQDLYKEALSSAQAQLVKAYHYDRTETRKGPPPKVAIDTSWEDDPPGTTNETNTSRFSDPSKDWNDDWG